MSADRGISAAVPHGADDEAVLPRSAATEVVIIGGGIAGVATAWYLQAFGVPFILCEKGRLAGEQSSRNWGWIRQQYRHPAELPLIISSLRLWATLKDELDDDIGWRRAGVTYLIENDADAARYADWLEHAWAYQLDSRLLSRAETDTLLPDNRVDHLGSLHTPSDARAEPALAVPAMGRSLRRRGGRLLENCAVRHIERAGGRVEGVVTEQGRIRCRQVVVAGGAWSSLLLRRLGVALPQLKVIASVLRTTAVPAVVESAVSTKSVAIRRRADGGYTLARSGSVRHDLGPDSVRHLRAYLPIARRQWRELRLGLGGTSWRELNDCLWPDRQPSPFERVRVLDPEPDHALLDDVLETARRYYPGLRDARSAARWAGVIDVLPDEIPVLGAVPGVDGLWVATGFSGHGFGIGPGAGRVTAQLAAGREPDVDVSGLRIDRFAGARVASTAAADAATRH